MMSLSRQCSITLSALIVDFVDEKDCPDIAIKGIALDSRQIRDGDLFIALQGADMDGASFISQAIDGGAVAILIEKGRVIESSVNRDVPIFGIKDLHEYVSHIAGVFYGYPSRQMALTAITGTNGKTTCSRLYAELIGKLTGGLVGFVGTLGFGMAGTAADADADISLLGKTGLTTRTA